MHEAVHGSDLEADLLEDRKQGTYATGTKKEGWERESVAKYEHNVVATELGSVLPDGLEVRQWSGMFCILPCKHNILQHLINLPQSRTKASIQDVSLCNARG